MTTGRAGDGADLVEWWAETVDGRLCAILVNTSEKPVSVEVDLPLLGPRRYNLKRYEVRIIKEK